MKDDAPRVIKIPAKPEGTRQAEARRQLRVAAYCRVSTKEEDQANSYECRKNTIPTKSCPTPPGRWPASLQTRASPEPRPRSVRTSCG